MNKLQMVGQKSVQKWQEAFQQGVQDALQNANGALLQAMREQSPEFDDAITKGESWQKAWQDWQEAWKELLAANEEWQEALKKDWQEYLAGPKAYMRLQQANQACEKAYGGWLKAWQAWQEALQTVWQGNGKKIAEE